MDAFDSTQHPFAGRDHGLWRAVAATVTGARHQRRHEPGQDAFACILDGPAVIAVVCDGAGSTSHGLTGARQGSHTVAHGLWKTFLSPARPDPGIVLEETTLRHHLLSLLETACRQLATNGPLRDHAATMVGVIASADGYGGDLRGYFFHIGDGAGLAVPRTEMERLQWEHGVVTQPENGEYANETCFFTDPDVATHLRLIPLTSADIIVLLSDGATPFTLCAGSTMADARFMDPVCRYLRSVPPADGARALHGSLGSDQASAISDDDKTLIYLQQRQSQPPAA
jgi:hypothetical protein